MAASVGSILAYGAHGVTAEWDQARWVDALSPFSGIGWPWCTGQPSIFADILDSETRETRTYQDDPDETDSWITGSLASYTDYSGLYDPDPPPSGALLTVKVEWRFKIGIDFDGLYGENFPTTQTVQAHWGLVTRDDTTAITDRETFAENISLTTASSRAATNLIEVDAPLSVGTIELSGPLRHPVALIQVQRTTSTREKWGFREYGRPSDPPKYYAREVADGSTSGCPATSVAAKDYDGEQEYDTSGVLTDDRSADAIADGFYSELRGRRNASLETELGLTVVSSTELTRDLSTTCEGSPAPGAITLTLEEEIETVDIEDPVDTEVASGTTSASGGSLYDAPLTLAWRHMALDESYYSRSKAAWRIALDFTDMEDAPSGADAISIPVAATVVTTDRRTGARTTSAITGTIDSDHVDRAEATSRLADPSDGDIISVIDPTVTGSPVLVGDSPYLTAVTNAVSVFPP